MIRIAVPSELQEIALRWRSEGRRVGLVPTMGALHEGHLSLVRAALGEADRVVVSIFVNPLQFGPREDLGAYPRDLESDCRDLEALGVHLAFTPAAESLYPEGHATRVQVAGLGEGLCGAHRPGHFEGVTTVVAMLLQLAQPHVAFFGKKDYQQWRILSRMARDLWVPVEVRGLPIVREPDGLALSSRNAYLSREERERALSLSRALHTASALFDAGERRARRLRAVALAELDGAVDRVDYVELRDAGDLGPVEVVERPAVLAIAAFVGRTRLIDNAELPPPPR